MSGSGVLFKCDWFDTKQGRGVKKDALGFTLVNFSKLIHIGTNLLDEPFVFASQVQQVFYIEDSLQPNWHIVVRTKPRDVYEMGDNLSFESSVEHYVQDDEMLDVDNDGTEDFSWVRNDIDDTIIIIEEHFKDKSFSEDEL